MKGNYLITTDDWFYARDGKSYKAAWGKIEVLQDDILGVKTNSRSTNWFAKVGDEENHVIIAGCQIHYAVKCEDVPNTDYAPEYTVFEGQRKEYVRPSAIYIAQKI